MNGKRLLPLLAGLALAVSACTQKNTFDQSNGTSDIPVGLERFLLFPNPLAMNTGGFETNTTDYADAYYRAIDPNNDKDTIDKWKAQNKFGDVTGTELLAVFRDTKDLGYGRRMTGRQNTDGSVAFYVENYNVTPNASGDYSSVLNVEAAIRRDTRWHVGTNAIEWSATPCIAGVDPADCSGTVRFAKYYNFSSKDGTRQLAVDLDGNGLKAMPGPCITCHGGRGDPLTPPDASTGKPRFPLVENSLSRKRGDVQGRLHGMNVDSFGYSPDIAGFSKTDQQATLKQFNQWILCTYPLAGAASGAEDNCRVPAGPNEWQGTAAEMIKSWYGGTGSNGMPNTSFADNYVPTNWQAGNVGSAAEDLYRKVVAPYCRTCHILRGTKNQDDIDFMKLGAVAAGSTPGTGFVSYADRIKAHVFDRGTMPLAKIVYDAFWSSTAPNQLAAFINPLLAPPQTVLDASGAALRPGRPVADPGPDRMVRTGADAILTGENSLFASTYSWSVVSGTAVINDPNSMITTFNATTDSVIRLTVGNGTGTDSKDLAITVDANFPDPVNIKFAHVKNVLQNLTYTTTQVPSGKKCVTCHTVTAAPQPAGTPPIWYNTAGFDRNGDGAVDSTDDKWFAKALRGRVNLTEITASQLLRKPSGNHHNGLMLLDTGDKTSGGGLSNYSILYSWILAGMPEGGVAANAGANSIGANSIAVTFSGAPLYASVALDGSQSIIPATPTYLWSVVSGPSGPTGAVPFITSPTSALATLNVPNTGDYVVRLTVSDGTFSDSALRKITVTENPITASFNPPGGDIPVTFSGNPLRGDITLASTSGGNPAYCQWQANGPAGALLEGVPVPAIFTTPCTSNATLNVPSGAITTSNDITLTAFGIGSNSKTNTLHIVDGTASVVAKLNNTTTPQAVVFGNSGTTTSIPTNTLVDGTGTAGTFVFNNVQSSVTLNGSASTTPQNTTLSYSWCLLSQPDASRFPASVSVCPSQTSSGTLATLSMTVRATGSYNVQLTVTNGLSTNATSAVIAVNPSRGFKFSDLTAAFTSIGCTGCHTGAITFGGTYYNPASNLAGFNPPDWENVADTDGTILYQRVRQRSGNNLLLFNPSNDTNGTNTNGHGGGCQPGFNIWGEAAFGAHGCPDTSRANYDNFNNWILDGAPPGN